MVVVVLTIAVPPTLGVLMSSASSRADAINTSRATMLASAVLEGLMADSASDEPALGFDALADDAAYLTTPGTGFYDRMAGVTAPYASLGLTYSVEIGPLVSSDGTTTGDPSEDVYRTLTVRVVYPSAGGVDFDLPVSVMVGDV